MALKGILGTKVGMTQVFDPLTNVAVPVTVIAAGPCRVAQVKTTARDGYDAVQLAFGEVRPKILSKPERGHLQKAGIAPSRYLAELRVDDPSEFTAGETITCDIFQPGDLADVVGTSKGKGFTGVMKRHNFQGQGAAHGNHKKHRAPGSIGACATPARVFRGMPMAGRMGGERVTVQNLDIVEVDTDRNLLLVRGAVPGAKGSVVLVREAVKG